MSQRSRLHPALFSVLEAEFAYVGHQPFAPILSGMNDLDSVRLSRFCEGGRREARVLRADSSDLPLGQRHAEA